MTSFVRVLTESGPVAGVIGDDGRIRDLDAPLGDLWRLRSDELRSEVERVILTPGLPSDEVRLLAPIDSRTPMWAAGVTYRTSRDARIEESEAKDVYERVYSAERPELFFKAQSHEVVTSGDPVGRRSDSSNDTPEPELAVVVNAFGEVVAFGVANDMSSRSIEGENPLYLPQAKVYPASAVLAPTLRVAWEIPDPRDLMIELSITRNGDEVFNGSTSTARMKRTVEELVSWLYRCAPFPTGVVLSTGTCVVPPLDQPVRDGDQITICIPEVGATKNRVVATADLAPWWRERLDNPSIQYEHG